MKKEEVLGEALECHECGEVGCPRTIIWLDHLCTHFIAFCHICYPKFVELVESKKPTMTVARTRYWADLLTACRGDYRGLVEEIVKEAGGEIIDD